MNCSNPLLHAYADGELDVANNLNVESHIRDCPKCAATARGVGKLRAALRGADLAYSAPAGLRSRVRAALPQLEESRGSNLLRFWQFLALGASATAALLLIFPMVRPAGNDLANEAVASHIRSLMAAHLTDVTSTDQHTVKPWFAGKLDFTPVVKDLAAQGFPLTGGRLDYVDGHPVAALVYKRKLHVINVFTWPGENGASQQKESRVRGYSIVDQTANGSHFYAVSDLNLDELKQFAAMLAE
jgi:anti-sigma factor RsiW